MQNANGEENDINKITQQNYEEEREKLNHTKEETRNY